MGKEKNLDLSDIPHSEEYMTVPADWKPVGQRQSVSRRTGKPITWVSFQTANGVREVADFALRRERGKDFEILTRIYNDLVKEDKAGATP